MFSLLFVIRNLKEKGRGEDPELSGVFSLVFLIRNLKEKGGGEDPELSGVFSLLFLIRNLKEKGRGGGSGAFRSVFLIVFNKEP